MNCENNPEHGEVTLDGCWQCGAPVCCPVCCNEATKEAAAAQPASEPESNNG